MSTADFRSLQATFVPRGDGAGQGRLVFWCMPPRRVDFARRALHELGVLRRHKSPPTGKLQLVIPTPTRNKTEEWEIAELTGIRLPLVETVRGLVRLDLHEAARARISDSVRVWALAAKLAVEMVAAGQIVPLLDRVESGAMFARWAVTSVSPRMRDRLSQLERALPLAAHALVLQDSPVDPEAQKTRKKTRRRRRRRPISQETRIWRPELLLRAFMDAVADAMCRDAAPTTAKDRPRKDNRELAPWELRWRYSLTASDSSFEHSGLVEQPLSDEVSRWASPVRPKATSGSAYSVAYQLELPGSSPETARDGEGWYLRYLLQANDDPSVIADAADLWAARGNRMEMLGRAFDHPHETLLESLAETAKLFPPVARSLYQARPSGVRLTTEEAWHFISTIGPILFQFGLAIRIPKELRSDGRQRLRLKLHVGTAAPDWNEIGMTESKVGLHALANFHWQVAVGDMNLSPEEFREIAALKEPLVQWRGQWMAVDPSELAEMERLFSNASLHGSMDRSSALAAALTGQMASGTAIGEIEVVAEGDIRRLVEAIRQRDSAPLLATPRGFRGELRPYQQRGLTWLEQMTALGFGVCLADDMGLGKTIQVIALLLHRAEARRFEHPALLICPTSVIGNWERELRRFSPELRIVRHHGRSRAANERELAEYDKPNTVVLSTYVISRIDHALLAQGRWSHLIVDEAQNIKNPLVRQAVAIRSLQADHRIALTGTPIENRLTELWSILELCNPGFLGSLGDFRRRFAVPIERFGDASVAETLRRMVGPFLLRRVKTDKAVIQDLPEKQEYKVYCSLTREQATLYQAAVDAALDRISGTSGLQRKANILALLTALKQICNHPSNYLKDFEARTAGRSGKLARITEMMEEVIAEGDHAIIFTQYKEMGDVLLKHFRNVHEFEMPFIHGGVAAEKRDEIVASFQNDSDAAPALLLSLKAGGTGLNLTRATHVFHFDRWWNPAVEDQATDRAYRVGQDRNVQVHKLVCSGTIEEKIDELLETKRDLADAIVGSGEMAVTEMSDDELRDMFTLGRGATVDDDEAEATP